MRETALQGMVYLVGAGPGDPELLTLKAARLLERADVVLHDDLVPVPVLAMAGKQALLMSVGKRCGRKRITQAGIHELMIASARKGLNVVRLKAGDPMIFGRAGEEIEALRAAGVAFEVVPGVTAASSAAALLGASLTDRRMASKLVILSGHQATEGGSGVTGFPHAALPARLADDDATYAIYMPGKSYGEIAASLLASSLDPAMPCVAVADASRPEAAYNSCRLGELAVLRSHFAPTLLLVGRVLEGVLTRDVEGFGAGPALSELTEALAIAVD